MSTTPTTIAPPRGCALPATRRLISDAVRKHISRDHERRRADAEARRLCRERTRAFQGYDMNHISEGDSI